MSSHSVAVIGHMALDIVFTNYPSDQEKRSSNQCDSIDLFPGGSGLNVASAVKYFLCDKSDKVSLFTRVGVDNDVSRPLLEVCRKRGIDVVDVSANDSKLFQTPRVAVLLNNEKERTFVAARNEGMGVEEKHLNEDVLGSIAKHDIVVFAGLTPRNGIAFAEMHTKLKRIRQLNPSCFIAGDVIACAGSDALAWRGAIGPHLANYDWFLPSIDELVQITSDQTDLFGLPFGQSVSGCKAMAEFLMRTYRSLSVVGIKLDSQGAVVFRRSDVGHESVVVAGYGALHRSGASLVDKNGAGDAWVGAFIAGAALSTSREKEDGGPSFDQAAKYGNAAASRCIKYLGATT
ncbi:MAG: carbohydrate kinase family protein [Planctomycetia bacterium]